MRVWYILFLAALALAGPAPVRASLITPFSLTDANQSGYDGDVLTFNGTVTDDGSGADVYVNGYWVDSADPALAAAVNFSFPLGLWPLGSGNTFTGDLFTADLTGLAPGTYNGIFWLQGGPGDGSTFPDDYQDLASASFSVEVLGGGSGSGNTPEPATLLLVGAGLAVAGVRRRRPKPGRETPTA